ncbi:hypothetical protein T08_4856 [Trichinella sp. T8]|nr:hypothetical protein T08_4856 [Trichinella sp. T8]
MTNSNIRYTVYQDTQVESDPLSFWFCRSCLGVVGCGERRLRSADGDVGDDSLVVDGQHFVRPAKYSVWTRVGWRQTVRPVSERRVLAPLAVNAAVRNSSGRSRTPEHPYLRSWLL